MYSLKYTDYIFGTSYLNLKQVKSVHSKQIPETPEDGTLFIFKDGTSVLALEPIGHFFED